mgnify:CR=1 FL=1
MKIFNHIMVLSLTALMLLSCGSQSKTYMPTNEGLTLTYNIDGNFETTMQYFKTRDLEGEKVIPMKIEQEGMISFLFYQKDKKGLKLYATQLPNAPQPILVGNDKYKYYEPIKAGQTWEQNYTTTLMMAKEEVPMVYEIKKEKETITVAAGTFEDCLKISGRGNIQREKGLWGTITLQVNIDEWYAPEIGLIKSVTHREADHVMVGEETTIMQLSAYEK